MNAIFQIMFPKGMRIIYLILAITTIFTSCEDPYWGGKDSINLNHDYTYEYDSIVYHHYTYDSIVHFVYDSVYAEIYKLVGMDVETKELVNAIGDPYAVEVTIYSVNTYTGTRTVKSIFIVPYGESIYMVSVEKPSGYDLIFYRESGYFDGYQQNDDEMVNQISIRHGQDGRKAIVQMRESETCTGFWFRSYVEGEPVPKEELYCLPSYVFSDVPIIENGDTTGFTFRIHDDKNFDGLLDAGDLLKYQKDIYHGTDGMNGINGSNGQNGKDGDTYGIETTFDYSNPSGVLITFTHTINGVFFSKTSTFISHGTNETNGANGANGADAINLYPESVKLYDSKGEQIGFILNVWRDTDGIPGISFGDKLSVSETIWFVGLKVSEKTYVGYTITTYSYLNNGVWETTDVRTTDGADGIDGVDGSDGSDGVDGADGSDGLNGADGHINVFLEKDTVMLYNGVPRDYLEIQTWLDLNDDLVYSSGDKYQKSFFIRQGDGLEGSFITVTRVFEFEDMDEGEMVRKGWLFTGNFYVGNDAIYSLAGATAQTQELRDDADLLSLRFRYGSQSSYLVLVQAVHDDGTISIIDTLEVNANTSFNWQNPSTYLWYNYHADLTNIKHTDLKRIKWSVENSSSKKCTNNDLVIDEVVIVISDRGHE